MILDSPETYVVVLLHFDAMCSEVSYSLLPTVFSPIKTIFTLCPCSNEISQVIRSQVLL